MPLIQPIIILTATVLGAIALVRLIRKEHRRINDELDATRMTPIASEAERDGHPTLRRDPRTGVYRP